MRCGRVSGRRPGGSASVTIRRPLAVTPMVSAQVASPSESQRGVAEQDVGGHVVGELVRQHPALLRPEAFPA